MLPLIDALHGLSSTETDVRLRSVHFIYGRTHEYSEEVLKACRTLVLDTLDPSILGAVDYIYYTMEDVLWDYMKGSTWKSILGRYPMERLSNETWTGSDMVAVRLRDYLRLPRPPMAKFMVFEPEGLQDFKLILRGTTDPLWLDVYEATCAALLRRSTFHAHEVAYAKQVLIEDQLRTGNFQSCVHVLMSSMQLPEIDQWVLDSFGEREFRKRWEREVKNYLSWCKQITKFVNKTRWW